MDHKISRSQVPNTSDPLDYQTLKLFGKHFEQEFFSGLPAEWAFYGIRHVLEKHGQNETVALSSVGLPSLKNFSDHLKSRYGWNAVEKFSLAWTLEWLPKNHLNNSFFLAKDCML
jgi:hypothetical protein